MQQADKRIDNQQDGKHRNDRSTKQCTGNKHDNSRLTNSETKALYEHYKDNENVEIISISVDEDVDAWKQKIVAKEMTWKQFICIGDDTMALSENYNLRSIPRFLIINKDGKLVDDNAPRPSSSNIVEVIDNYLK